LIRLVRAPDLLLSCERRRFFVKDLDRGTSVSADFKSVALLTYFDRPRSAESAARDLPGLERGVVLRTIGRLRRLHLLLPEGEGRRRTSRLKAWNHNLASAQYHAASRDVRYIEDPKVSRDLLRARVGISPRPARFKRYAKAPHVPLPRGGPVLGSPIDFDEVLACRRTVREFSPEPVPFERFAATVRSTWGKTGWIESDAIGRLVAKTSPSGGGLHPVECYVIAWNVAGLPRGLYHYDVRGDELRRLRRGDLRAAAIRSASGQRWVASAAFLCVMTAVFERTLWKYRVESAYRVVWLDAGHLAQTFCLSAVSRGLGPFTTAAIQDSYIEKLIGLDGIKEFPVYLCGAGIPAKKLL
jgi:SagB-type dehydrogenase family enzyme